MPEISIIFAYRNRKAVRVRNCLNSLAKQTFTDFEVVFIDNGSNAFTSKEIRSLVEEYSFVRYYYNHSEGREWNKAAALNNAINIAKAEYILSSDIDLIFTSSVLAKLNKIKSEYGHINSEVFWLPRDYDIDELLEEQPNNFKTSGTGGLGGVYLIKKQDLMALGGYDEFYAFWGVEDRDIYNRMKSYGLSHHWIDVKKFPVYHQWHLPVTYESCITIPDKWWDDENIYFELNKHNVIRRRYFFATHLRIEDRPILDHINNKADHEFVFSNVKSAIEKSRAIHEIITCLINTNHNSILKITTNKKMLSPKPNYREKLACFIFNKLINYFNLKYVFLPKIYRTLSMRHMYFIPALDVNYLCWKLVRETKLVRDYYIQENESEIHYYLMRS